MSNIQTTSSKNHHNQYVVKSTVMIDEVKRLQLIVHTSKVSSGSLVTSASVDTVSEDGYSSIHAMFTDFNKRLLVTKPKRVTLKIVEEQHQLVNMEDVIAEAKVFYGLV